MSWLIFAATAYFLNAIAMLVDKFLLTKKVGEPVVFTFYVSVLGVLALALWPFGYVRPSMGIIGLAFLSGLSFTAGLFYLYKMLGRNDASQIGPLVGAMTAIFTIVLAFYALDDRLSATELSGAGFLILGTFLLWFAADQLKLKISTVIAAAVFFGLSAVLAKLIYTKIYFITGLVLMRLGSTAAALLLLLRPAYYQAIVRSWRTTSTAGGGLLILGQSAGALAAILISYATSIGSVSLINALQGVQYVFLLLLTALLSHWAPQILIEDLRGRRLLLRLLAVALISLGLAFILLL